MFPDVLDMCVRSLRSGFPISAAMRMVAENMDPPVSTEFKQVVEEMEAGRSVIEALTRMSRRVNEPDVNFFIVVLKVQQETGGNLSEVISNLSRIIRQRKQLRMKIIALTSEGRTTAYILSSLPVLIFSALYFIQRDYLEPLWTTYNGKIILGIVISLIVGGHMIVNKMIKIEV
jgi:tight adherence protein B